MDTIKIDFKLQDFVRIMPFQRCENWLPKLTQMSMLYHFAEYETLKRGVRQAATWHVDHQNLDRELERFNRDGLIFTPLRKSGYYQGFAHYHHPVKPGEPFFWYGVLTRTYKDAQIFKEADKKGDHFTIGKMLGYPECCIKYFIENFPKNYDPIWVDLEGKVKGYPEANQMLRYFGIRITSHLSCSPICKETKKVGEIWFKIMKEKNEKLAKELYQLLSGKIIWNSYHGVVEVETPYFVGVTHTFPYFEKPRIIYWQGINKKA